ncbi:hypothetical protein CDD81_7219 [Ophiocordyceps australis]|uniref:Uncharacterized protein n=1 Tax=Ophiocordyceps australis TaxID=1399860 RepID=A0A2C5Y0Z5_9HYPO|nr:hypothetical protein CDD81_7219 [Ophiocordyceps australis]
MLSRQSAQDQTRSDNGGHAESLSRQSVRADAREQQGAGNASSRQHGFFLGLVVPPLLQAPPLAGSGNAFEAFPSSPWPVFQSLLSLSLTWVAAPSAQALWSVSSLAQGNLPLTWLPRLCYHDSNGGLFQYEYVDRGGTST